MQKNHWLDLLTSKLRSQISQDNAEKAQSWALALTGLIALGLAFTAVGSAMRTSVYGVKVLFLILFHLITVLGFYLPGFLQKGQKPGARLLGICDFNSLVFMSLALTFYAAVTLIVSYQVAADVERMDGSNFFTFVAWANCLMISLYLIAGIFYFLSLAFFPHTLVRMAEKGTKASYFFLGNHVTFLVLLSFGFTEMEPIGSPAFFDQFRIAGLFWIFIAASIFFMAKLSRQSAAPALSNLEFEIASGKLERSEDILARFKEAFIQPRLSFWVSKQSHNVAGKAHEIAQHTHESVSLVSRPKPSEIDLRQVEDRYRRADHSYKKLEKDNSRFIFCAALFQLSEAEQEKIEELRDQFSRELRNAKLELASVRKKIDETLVSFKNAQPAPEVPVEKVPLSR